VAFDGGPPVLDGVDLSVESGVCRGLVGESGSGKTLLALAVAGLLPPGAAVTGGSILLHGRELAGLPPRARRELLAREIGIVFQDPVSALHPAWPVGAQVAEAMRAAGSTRRAARLGAVALLGRLGLPEPERRAREFAHQLSGGMCQRVGLAMALAKEPSLLLADEPTTALDVTVQAGILWLLEDLRRERGIGVVLVSHDLGVVAGSAARITVLYAGRVAEEGAVEDVFARPLHPYTAALLAATPGRGGRLAAIPGSVPSPEARPAGCSFAPRCGVAEERCRAEIPDARRFGEQSVSCHRAERGDG
jgi:oligopeptide/dipeptide ABC transporter ATP-binding protein